MKAAMPPCDHAVALWSSAVLVAMPLCGHAVALWSIKKLISR